MEEQVGNCYQECFKWPIYLAFLCRCITGKVYSSFNQQRAAIHEHASNLSLKRAAGRGGFLLAQIIRFAPFLQYRF